MVKYTAGTNKGSIEQGDVFNDPFRLGKVDPDYTSSAVVEPYTAASTPADTTLAWTPVLPNSFRKDDGTPLGDVKYVDGANSLYGTFATEADRQSGIIGDGSTLTWVDGDGTSAAAPTLTGKSVAYRYNNVIIPQNDIPTLNAEMAAIPLMTKTRRIAIYYSQIAAFQANKDYGFDLGDQLAQKAAGQLAYEIDTEIVDLLSTMAGDPETNLTWSKTLPIGVSKAQHYEGFAEIIALANQIIYDKTQRFAATYMVIASSILPVLSLVTMFKPAATGNINGPYFAGTFGPLKVFVSPRYKNGEFVVGVNGDDYASSAAVYAPYLPIVPTMLLQGPDGGTSQGFSTVYALEKLNEDLVVKGQVTA